MQARGIYLDFKITYVFIKAAIVNYLIRKFYEISLRAYPQICIAPAFTRYFYAAPCVQLYILKRKAFYAEAVYNWCFFICLYQKLRSKLWQIQAYKRALRLPPSLLWQGL